MSYVIQIDTHEWVVHPCRVDIVASCVPFATNSIDPNDETPGYCANCRYYTPRYPDDLPLEPRVEAALEGAEPEEDTDFRLPPERGACLKFFPFLTPVRTGCGCVHHSKLDSFYDSSIDAFTLSIFEV